MIVMFVARRGSNYGFLPFGWGGFPAWIISKCEKFLFAQVLDLPDCNKAASNQQIGQGYLFNWPSRKFSFSLVGFIYAYPVTAR